MALLALRLKNRRDVLGEGGRLVGQISAGKRQQSTGGEHRTLKLTISNHLSLQSKFELQPELEDARVQDLLDLSSRAARKKELSRIQGRLGDAGAGIRRDR